MNNELETFLALKYLPIPIITTEYLRALPKEVFNEYKMLFKDEIHHILLDGNVKVNQHLADVLFKLLRDYHIRYGYD